MERERKEPKEVVESDAEIQNGETDKLTKNNYSFDFRNVSS
jgi:hypothetical protein